jgi:hypothetical protein
MIICYVKDGWLHKVPLTFLGLHGANFNAHSKDLVMKLKKFMVVPTFLYG